MAVQKATAAKKKTVKATPKSNSKKTATKNKQAAPLKSFQLSPETEKFISSKFTRQTIYWLIIGLEILILGIIIIKSQINIFDILNDIAQRLH